MADESRYTFVSSLEVWRGVVRDKAYARLVMLACGWVLAAEPRSITAGLVAAGLAGHLHHEAFHRLFSRRAWCPDELGRRLFSRLEAWAGDGLEVVIDDTLASHKGPKVFGLGRHIDAVRSTRRQRIFAFGHLWVVLAVRVRVPFSRRAWALPVLFRLYRNLKDCERRGDTYRKKTELAREVLDVFTSWTQRPVRVLADLAYCNETLQRELEPRISLVGTMRPDAVLTALPTEAERKATGRRRRKGRVLPKPEALARDTSVPWLPIEVVLYGVSRVVRVKSLQAQWYQACGIRLLHVVVVRMETGSLPWRVFFSTDPDLTPKQVLESYAGRWSLEVTFRDLKQHFGFGAPGVRHRLSVERIAPFSGLVFTSLVLWAAEHPALLGACPPLLRPWYRHKDGLSSLDLLRAVRHDLAGPTPTVSDLPRLLDNLQNVQPAQKPRGRPRLNRAA